MRTDTILAILGGAWLAHRLSASRTSAVEESPGSATFELSPHGLEVAKTGETGGGRWRVQRETDEQGGVLVWRWDAVIPGGGKASGQEQSEEEAIGRAQSWLLGGVSD